MDTPQASIENQVPEATTPNEPPPELSAEETAAPAKPADERPRGQSLYSWLPNGP